MAYLSARRPLTACLLSFLVASSAAAADASHGTIGAGSPPEISHAALFRHLSEGVWVPLSQEFRDSAATMAEVAQTRCRSAGGVESMQQAWRALQRAWQPLEVAQFGPVVERRTQRHVNAWPVRPRLLEPFLENARVTGRFDSGGLQRLGVSGKGLPALEYLLFPVAQDGAVPFDASACPVIAGLANQIADEAQELLDQWTQPDGGFAHQLGATLQTSGEQFSAGDQALSDLINLMIAGLELVKTRKLAKPMEQGSDRDAALERIESWRSGSSLENVARNLDGLEKAFFGGGKNQIGLDDYLIGIRRPNLSRLVREDLDAARRALASITLPLEDAVVKERDKVGVLLKAVTALQARLESDIAEALKVDLGFNTADGD